MGILLNFILGRLTVMLPWALIYLCERNWNQSKYSCANKWLGHIAQPQLHNGVSSHQAIHMTKSNPYKLQGSIGGDGINERVHFWIHGT